MNLCSIILAAGDGTRMKSDKPKVLSTVLFKPMLKWVIDAVKATEIKDICVVAGFKHELITEYLNQVNSDVDVTLQRERKGTAHAVMMATEFLKKHLGSDVLIVGGDSPFIDSDTITESFYLHRQKDNAATVISAKIKNPFGYGRIVRNEETQLLESIVEHKDANEDILKIKEVNSGAYWFKVDKLLSVLADIKNENAQGEFYLPDSIRLLMKLKFKVDSFVSKSNEIVLGANDFVQLKKLNEIALEKNLVKLMKNGVDIPCTDGVMIGKDVEFGRNVRVLPGTIINGKCKINDNCLIGPNSFISDSEIGENVVLNSVYCLCANISQDQNIKPFSVIIK